MAARCARSLSSLVHNYGFKGLLPVRNYASGSGQFILTSFDQSNGYAEVKMNRGPVNSQNLEFLQEMSATIKELENTKGCKGMILTSNLPTIFSAGLDIMEMYKPKQERMANFWSSLQQLWMDLYGTKLITIAAINGHAPAGGCLLSLSCDYRIMVAGKYTIGLNETQLGIVAPLWFQGVMQNTIGTRLTELSLNLGKLYSVEEALKINLIDDVAANQDELMQKAKNEMVKWMKIPGIARQLTKSNLRKKHIDALLQYREQDIATFVGFASAEKTQQSLGMYLEALKKKK